MASSKVETSKCVPQSRQKFALPEDQKDWLFLPRNAGRRTGRIFKGRYKYWDPNWDARNRAEAARLLEAWRAGDWPPQRERERSEAPRVVDLAEKSTLLLSHQSTSQNTNTSKSCDIKTDLEHAMDAVLRGCMSTGETTASEEHESEDEFEASLFERKSAKAKSLSARILRNIDRVSTRNRALSGKKFPLDDDNLFDPENFRHIPLYVFVARLLDQELFSKIIYFFFERKRWPQCCELPRQVHRFCKLCGITEDYKDMPAFAPEWVFHLQVMNNSMFWTAIRYFFRYNKFPSWDTIPSLYTNWFENLDLGEFEYPSLTKFEKIPQNVKRRYKILLEWRLQLTKLQFPKGKDHFDLEISSKSTEELRECSSL